MNNPTSAALILQTYIRQAESLGLASALALDLVARYTLAGRPDLSALAAGLAADNARNAWRCALAADDMTRQADGRPEYLEGSDVGP